MEMRARVDGRLDCGPGPPAGELPGGDAGEEPAGQPDRGDRGQLRDLGPGGIQADIARIGPDGRETSRPSASPPASAPGSSLAAAISSTLRFWTSGWIWPLIRALRLSSARPSAQP